MAKSQKPEFIRLLFPTLLGSTKCLEISYDRLDEVLNDGAFFDGSSVPGYAPVNCSDMLLRPMLDLPLVLPYDTATALMPCRICDTDGRPHPMDPVAVLERITEQGASRNVRLMAGCELEFFLVRLDSASGSVLPCDQGEYMSAVPADGGLNLRRMAVRSLDRMAVHTSAHHHEVAHGQQEIVLRHADAITSALNVMLAKHVIADLARRQGLIATFMAKPFAAQNGSGMHVHQSLWDTRTETNLFASDEKSVLSETGVHYVNGILEHAPALSAIVAPTVNSYKRLVPGFEAPTMIAWGPSNRTTMIRVPHFNGSQDRARIEYRCPDPSCSPFLALAGILAAGIDGVEREAAFRSATSQDLYHMTSACETLPGSLLEAIDSLVTDKTMSHGLGTQLVSQLSHLKTREWEDYSSHVKEPYTSDVTPWELNSYLASA